MDLATQFQAVHYVMIGLQETRRRIPRARGIGPYVSFAAAAGNKGQGGLELWVLRTWVQKVVAQLVLYATNRILIARLATIKGAMQAVVANALDSSCPNSCNSRLVKRATVHSFPTLGQRHYHHLDDRCKPQSGISPIRSNRGL